ncbi:MAG: DNA-directed RNA polymerase subunit beta [Acidobacteriota bacterium]|nr:DNA-directed RNA polymerase subunit beta [Blastocatellia bacterium]MDW8240187.1 DNA-directed RNA polymerase subunit beta [Acidobacteriota bacterium]
MPHQANNGHQRLDFSRIRTAIGIPNLIEIQRQSYNQLMQMDLLPEERKPNEGLQAVFQSVFPISDYRNSAQLDFVSYSMGIWQCKCGQLEGLEHLRSTCRKCKATIRLNPLMSDHVLCLACGATNKNVLHLCPNCSEPVGLKLKYDVLECQERGMTYAVPMKVKFRLTVFDVDEASGRRSVRDIKEEEVYFGDVPLMTENGTFIVNGTERVIVSQLHRSPGIYFEKPSTHGYLGKIIPNRGAWVEFEYDAKNILYVRIDKKRKILGSVFLRALGLPVKVDLRSIDNDELLKTTILTARYSDEEILRLFYKTERIRIRDGKLFWQLDRKENPASATPKFADVKTPTDIVNPKTGEVIVKAGRKISTHAYREILKADVKEIELNIGDLEGAMFISDLVDPDGEIRAEANTPATPQAVSSLIVNNIREFEVFIPDRDEVGHVLSTTLKKDSAKSPAEALVEIYRKMRPGDPPTVLSAWRLFESMFFDPRKFDFSKVGRLKFNIKIGYDQHHRIDDLTLSPSDFFDVVRYLLKLHRGIGEIDDRDHLGNRRVRAVGELLENQFRIGLVRMERAIKEKMSVHAELQTAMPRDLVNAKPVIAALKEFFGSSQLSQFMDQTNPLSEITHKRRLSALGPGGLSRERAGFEVRDVHPTHYGRICPIETPEGPNIGLISSLACYARIDEFGFIQAPYRKVEDGRVIDYVRITSPGDSPFKLHEHLPQHKVEKVNRRLKHDGLQPAEYEPYPFYLTAWEEAHAIIGQANIELDENNYIVPSRVPVRKAGEFATASREEVQYIDISPKQLVSVAASLIPFLEHDDANRALMGSNMQRQSVPLLRPEAPIVGTGMEDVVARDSGAVVVARRDGVVDKVDSERIIIRADQETRGGALSREVTADIYQLIKFKRSNQNTCINQKPIVHVGQRVKKGQVIADGPCTDQGELALGRNVLVAFMPWRGYNFEDAILISEKLVREDAYTSVHIEELEVEARDTKLGPEDITRDIPNVSEYMLRDLDESGIIRIGAYVRPGSILVGKVTPKGETQLTPEEKLLRAIFGEKAGDVRDASLKCPPGIEGTVIDVKVFTRRGVTKDARSLAIEQAEEDKLRRNLQDEIRILEEERDKRIRELLEGQRLAADLFHNRRKVLEKGEKLTRDILNEMEFHALRKIQVANPKVDVAAQIKEMEARTHRQVLVLEHFYKERIEKLRRGDELPAGVIKMVKVYIAMKRKMSVGDKMAGRHGNKGVIARILPIEDMPYLEDGTPVEIVLNPLGVPSRMNVGQLLETHLGWAGHALGLRFSSPVFDGATEEAIREKLLEAGLPPSGKVTLYDGMTGEPFQEKVTVGYIYMMKLSHLVDDKIHARSIGPYSLITQQPLGGKAQFGGQRFGEMEVWALEAYGAAYTLQELLTAKSDDVAGRSRIYEGIVNGNIDFQPGVPESFSVLVRELQGLCLDVELIKRDEEFEAANREEALAAD